MYKQELPRFNEKCTKVLNLAAVPSVYCRVHVDVHLRLDKVWSNY